ncbi:hypothetical protein Poli38472_013807 [Pythium oligandrum]|uniref:t-SNARE coiled-coil homology domain-containing protein n=1 Tax=Pythium oligandrum TaxID=41045 RepID=A0A8K1C248_PYTOL|nr:hypothetical protein Poli38472_013807 [Pythium oligandrum]|eukprot:TMW55045.1 hypothetical protein Poli38472_013807 [Pythium oligandrum]
MRRNEWETAANAMPDAAPGPRMTQGDRRDHDVKAKHTESLRAMADSLQIARETAHTLSMQSEQLGRSEAAVEEAQYAVDLSKRVMRGMTWSGWIANAFTAPPQMESEKRKDGGDITMGFICPECKIVFKDADQLGTHYGKAHAEPHNGDSSRSARPSSMQATTNSSRQLHGDARQAREDVHDDFLRQLEPQLAELKQASLALGNALDTQNEQLDRLDGKVDRVHDGMKRISVQAKKLAGQKAPLTYRFRCAFQEVETRRFLRDVDGEPVLGADVLVDGCTFRAYTLGDDHEIWGFQSEQSSFFLGVNRYGNLKIRGNDLQSYEHMAIDHDKTVTRLFCYASYFGIGGWVVRSAGEKLTIVRGSVENKPSAAMFKLLNLDQIQAALDQK